MISLGQVGSHFTVYAISQTIALQMMGTSVWKYLIVTAFIWKAFLKWIAGMN